MPATGGRDQYIYIFNFIHSKSLSQLFFQHGVKFRPTHYAAYCLVLQSLMSQCFNKNTHAASMSHHFQGHSSLYSQLEKQKTRNCCLTWKAHSPANYTVFVSLSERLNILSFKMITTACSCLHSCLQAQLMNTCLMFAFCRFHLGNFPPKQRFSSMLPETEHLQ